MQANEPTSKEYDSIAIAAHTIVAQADNAIRQFIKYARRMAPYSEVDNGALKGCIEDLAYHLANVGSKAEQVRLYAIACETEAEVCEKEDQQEDEESDGERPE